MADVFGQLLEILLAHLFTLVVWLLITKVTMRSSDVDLAKGVAAHSKHVVLLLNDVHQYFCFVQCCGARQLKMILEPFELMTSPAQGPQRLTKKDKLIPEIADRKLPERSLELNGIREDAHDESGHILRVLVLLGVVQPFPFCPEDGLVDGAWKVHRRILLDPVPRSRRFFVPYKVRMIL